MFFLKLVKESQGDEETDGFISFKGIDLHHYLLLKDESIV